MASPIGRVLLMDKGAYSGSTVYNQLDWVRDNGAAWVCKVDGTVGIAPPTLPTTSNANWTLMAADGSVSGSIEWSAVNNKPFTDLAPSGGLTVDANTKLKLDTSYLIGSNIGYDNTSSGMTADNVQDAIDELKASSGGGVVVVDTQVSLDGTTVTFDDIDTTKSYMLQADYPDNYNGPAVGLDSFEITNDGATPPVYSVTYTVTNATVNQSFDLLQIG